MCSNHSLLEAAKLSEPLLFDRSQQQDHDRGGDHGQITNARQAAEALFAPKRQPFKQLRYGMTTEQVADVYGVPVDEIERILRIT
jgi:hypothetical protein